MQLASTKILALTYKAQVHTLQLLSPPGQDETEERSYPYSNIIVPTSDGGRQHTLCQCGEASTGPKSANTYQSPLALHLV